MRADSQKSYSFKRQEGCTWLWSSFKGDKHLHSSLSNGLFTDAQQQSSPSYLLPLPRTKGNPKPNRRFGNEPSVWSKMSKVLSYCDLRSESNPGCGHSLFIQSSLVLSGEEKRNRSEASSKQREPHVRYTRGRGYSRLPSCGLIQIKLLGFPKQFEGFVADSIAIQTLQSTTKATLAVSQISVLNTPSGQRQSWLWLLCRKWERHKIYMRCTAVE